MGICINKNSVEYQSLKAKAGVPELLLETVCSRFLEQQGRFPYLDEIPGANSSSFLKSILKLSDYKGTSIQNILDYTSTTDINEANTVINNIHRDLETEIIPIINDAIVNIKQRSSDQIMKLTQKYTPDTNVNSQIWIIQALDKLSNLYGIKINEITDEMLLSEEWSHIDKMVDGFIQNGQIYINTDRASVDTPIHEMMHLLLGSLQFTDSNIYYQLVNTVETLPQYKELSQNFVNRTKSDINEEIFITEISKYLAGIPSAFEQLSESSLYEINYNIRRILDTILSGELSTKTLTDDVLYNQSLRSLAKLTNSNSMNNTFSGTFNEEGSALHRKLNNMKSDLIEKDLLKEICE